MKYYLDTNILAFLLLEQEDELSGYVMSCVSDYSNTLFTSVVCVQELIHLCQIGKLSMGKKKVSPNPTNIVNWLDDMGICIVPVNLQHLQKLSELPLFNDHHDPNDRLIIVQAIVDHAPLVSSDHKFKMYERLALHFVLNRR